MKVVLLAGGFGTRLTEESHLRPKPMIEIGDQPILWHIMKLYSHYGYNDFVICAGYKQHVIKEYFADYYLHRCDVTFDFSQGGSMCVHSSVSEPWRVTIVNTGLETMTGGRVKRIQPYIGEEPFLLTYGDGVSNVNIEEQVRFHKKHGKIATMTSINVGQQFGVIEFDEAGMVTKFREKQHTDGRVINGGFMVLNPEVFDYITEGDASVFERNPLEGLARDGELMAYQHQGFWQCMDTQRDKQKLEDLWASGNAPWKVW
ncbi:MAG: glucose-1-phosphate cytidylyltransferase [Christensenella sp.]|nr:glucose-1-phosphate cytidylyltransferase [Christensenella sp.]